MVENIHKLYSYGLFITAGFIVGFDSEKASMADAMADFIEECAIPVSMRAALRIAEYPTDAAAGAGKGGCTKATMSCARTTLATSA